MDLSVSHGCIQRPLDALFSHLKTVYSLTESSLRPEALFVEDGLNFKSCFSNLDNPKYFALMDIASNGNAIFEDETIHALLFKIYDIARFFHLKNKDEKLRSLNSLVFILGTYDVCYNLFCVPKFRVALDVLIYSLKMRISEENDSLVKFLLNEQLNIIHNIHGNNVIFELSSEDGLSEQQRDSEYDFDDEITNGMLLVLSKLSNQTIIKPRI